MSEQEARQNQSQDDRITQLEKGQARILELLEPIADTYRSVNLLGKWLVTTLVFISVLGGVIATWTKLFDK